MTRMASSSVVRQLEAIFEGGSVVGISDRQLVERYITGGGDPTGQAAFAALVARHGPMVLSVCRQFLGDYQHAEDAFQAVFLVLARKAGAIREPDLLGNWLYGVAIRTARCARQRIARRQREGDGAMRGLGPGRCVAVAVADPPADGPAVAREQAEALHEEIARLPRAFRLPVVLCYFEGLSLNEAARRLRCPAGTVHSRLARAREQLRIGLKRRGIVLPAAALSVALMPCSASASIPPLLCDSTTRAAIAFAARHAAGSGALSTPAAAMAQEVLRTMLIHKLKHIVTCGIALAVVATGAGLLTRSMAMKEGPMQEPSGVAVAPRPEDRPAADAPGRMTVAGRVLDPRGQPVPGAAVMIYARSLAPASSPAPPAGGGPQPIGAARADDSGRFRIETLRTSGSGHEYFGAVALAPGYGAGWARLDPDADQPGADIALRPEQEIRGRLFDVQGRPVVGVRVSVSSISRPGPLGPARGRAQFDGATLRADNTIDTPAWPASTTTDAEGRFVLRGIGRSVRVGLMARHPQFAPQAVAVDTDEAPGPKAVTAALAPPQIIHVRLTYSDNEKPVPHAPLLVTSSIGRAIRIEEAETDAEGRARLNPFVADRLYGIIAYPPEGQPYLATRKNLEWPKGSLEQSVELALPRGALIRGTVTEAGSGRPVAGAIVTFAARGDRGITLGGPVTARSAADGSFRVGGKPGPGLLLVKGPGDDYVLEAVGSRMINEGQPGGGRFYINAHAALDLKPGVDTEEVRITLRRGVTVTGLVLGPDGRPAPGTRIIGRAVPDPTRGVRGARSSRAHAIARGGRFELPGIDPDAETPVYFLDTERKLGATVNLSGKSIAMLTLAGRDGRVELGATIGFSGGSMVRGPITVGLEPCGSARARFVDRDGHSVAAQLPRDIALAMVITPGALFSREPAQPGALFADLANPAQIDPLHYTEELTADAEGRLTLPVLIPGASYWIVDHTGEPAIAPRLRKDFTVKPGETLDLGDILIEKPPG